MWKSNDELNSVKSLHNWNFLRTFAPTIKNILNMKKNTIENYESINVRLTKWTFPIAFNNKVEELLEEKAFKTREEAEKWLSQTPIELEIYYEKGAGLFGVEAEALESASNTICSPYSKESFED